MSLVAGVLISELTCSVRTVERAAAVRTEGKKKKYAIWNAGSF